MTTTMTMLTALASTLTLVTGGSVSAAAGGATITGGVVSELPYESIVSIESYANIYWADEYDSESHYRDEQVRLYEHYGSIRSDITTEVMFDESIDDIDRLCNQTLFNGPSGMFSERLDDVGIDYDVSNADNACVLTAENASLVDRGAFENLTLLREFSGGHRFTASYDYQLIYENWPNYPSVLDPSRLILTFSPANADWGQNMVANPEMMHPDLVDMLTNGDIEYMLELDVEGGEFYRLHENDNGPAGESVAVIDNTVLTSGGDAASDSSSVMMRIAKDDVSASEVINTGETRQNVVFGLIFLGVILVLLVPPVFVIASIRRRLKVNPNSDQEAATQE